MMHNGRQKTLERANRLGRRGAIAQIRLLHDVFRLHRAAHHAVGYGEQQRTVFFKWLSLHSIAFRTLGVISIWRQDKIVVRFVTWQENWGLIAVVGALWRPDLCSVLNSVFAKAVF